MLLFLLEKSDENFSQYLIDLKILQNQLQNNNILTEKNQEEYFQKQLTLIAFFSNSKKGIKLLDKIKPLETIFSLFDKDS